MRILKSWPVPSSLRISLGVAVVAGWLWAGGVAAQSWQGPISLGIQVTDSDGAPVAGAEVEVQYAETDTYVGPPPGQTDSAGRLEMHGLAEGLWKVRVSREGYSASTVVVRVDVGKKKARVVASLREGPAPPLNLEFVKSETPGAVSRQVAEVREEKGKKAKKEKKKERGGQRISESEPEEPASAPRPGIRPVPPPPSPARREPTPEPAPTPEPRSPEPTPEPVTAAPPTPTPAPATPAPEPIPPAPAPVEEEPAPAPAPVATRPAPEAEAGPVPAPEPVERAEPTPPPAAAPAAPPKAPEVSPEPAPEPAPATPKPAAAERPAAPAPAPEPAPEAEPLMPEPEPEPEPITAEPAAPPMEAAPAPPPPPAASPEPGPAPSPRPRAMTAARTYRDKSCSDCKPGEAAVSAIRYAAAGDGSCPSGWQQAVREAVRRLTGDSASRLSGYTGALFLGDAGAERLAAVASEETLVAVEELLAPWTDQASDCQILGVVLDPAVKFTGYRYEVRDGSGASDCLAGQECPLGAAVWMDHPRVEKTPQGTFLWALFQNRSTDLLRRSEMTVYFDPTP